MKKTVINAPYLWLLPSLVILVFFVVLPLCITTIYSFYQINLRHLDKQTFIGIWNYLNLMQDLNTINSLLNSFFYLVIALVTESLLGILLALALKDKFIGREIILAVLIIPWALPPLVNGIVWRLIFEPTCGIWNDFLLKTGFIEDYQVWLNNPQWSKWLITMVHVWKMLPLIVVIFLAKLQTMPEDSIEAAKIDGANYWQRFRYIIFPFLKPVLVITLAQGTIAAFNLFDEAYIMTGTALDTRSLLIQDYLISFREMNLGKGMALSLLISLISLILMYIFMKLGDKSEK